MLTEVPFLPSNKLYKQAIKYLEIQKGDKVIDIGCGDGRVLRYAAKKYPEAQFLGIDRNPLLIGYAKFLSIFKPRKNLKFKRANIHDFDISEFDKIYLYLLPNIVQEVLEEKRDQLKEGCIVLSFHYPFSKKFFGINNIVKYHVKYSNKEENIFKWVNK
jgi:SAM-dependent methyltransferase